MPLRVTGVDEALAEHQEAARRARDLRVPLEQSRAELAELVQGAFGSRSSLIGEAWEPTKRESTAGDVLGSLVIEAGPSGLSINVEHEGARFFAFGTSRQPARNFLPFDAAEQPFEDGAAGEWWSGQTQRVKRYLELEDQAAGER